MSTIDVIDKVDKIVLVIGYYTIGCWIFDLMCWLAVRIRIQIVKLGIRLGWRLK